MFQNISKEREQKINEKIEVNKKDKLKVILKNLFTVHNRILDLYQMVALLQHFQLLLHHFLLDH